MNDLIYLIYSIGEEEGICFILGIDYFLSDQMKVTIVTPFKCRLAIADTSLVHRDNCCCRGNHCFLFLCRCPHIILDSLHALKCCFSFAQINFVQLKVQYITLCFVTISNNCVALEYKRELDKSSVHCTLKGSP